MSAWRRRWLNIFRTASILPVNTVILIGDSFDHFQQNLWIFCKSMLQVQYSPIYPSHPLIIKKERLKSTDISKEFCVYLFFKPYVNWVPVYLTWIWMTLHITWNVILSPNHLLSPAQPYPALNSTKPVLTSSLHILCTALLTIVLSAKCNIPLPLTPLLFILSIYL